MTLDEMLAEALLDGYVGTRRGTAALLAFWRVWRHDVPQHAAITDAHLADLEQAHARPVLRYDAATGAYDYAPPDAPCAEVDALHQRRAVWQRLRAVLDQPDDAALEALYALVNGPDAAALMPFYVTLAPPPSPPDPRYDDYLRHFYNPYARHARPRLLAEAAVAETATAAGEVPRDTGEIALSQRTTPTASGVEDTSQPSVYQWPSPRSGRGVARQRRGEGLSPTRHTIRVGGLHPPAAPESKTPPS